jgi:hypothetical protein
MVVDSASNFPQQATKAIPVRSTRKMVIRRQELGWHFLLQLRTTALDLHGGVLWGGELQAGPGWSRDSLYMKREMMPDECCWCECHANTRTRRKKRGAGRIISLKTSQYAAFAYLACVIAQLVGSSVTVSVSVVSGRWWQ